MAIDQLLARSRSSGSYGGLSLLAREELDAGRLACAAQIHVRLVEGESLSCSAIRIHMLVKHVDRACLISRVVGLVTADAGRCAPLHIGAHCQDRAVGR